MLDPYSRGSKVFQQMTEILRRSTSDSERASVFRWIQDVAAKVVAWSTELRECNDENVLKPEEAILAFEARLFGGGNLKPCSRQVCAKCNRARAWRWSPNERHLCPIGEPERIYYWLGYGIETRDLEQVEWLTVEQLGEAIQKGFDLRYVLQLLLQKLRLVAETGADPKRLGLPVHPDEWLETLRDRDNRMTDQMAEEYRVKHGDEWGLVGVP